MGRPQPPALNTSCLLGAALCYCVVLCCYVAPRHSCCFVSLCPCAASRHSWLPLDAVSSHQCAVALHGAALLCACGFRAICRFRWLVLGGGGWYLFCGAFTVLWDWHLMLLVFLFGRFLMGWFSNEQRATLSCFSKCNSYLGVNHYRYYKRY